jgi:hypothetical protein
LLEGAAVLPVGAKFVKALLKAVTVPTRTAVTFLIVLSSYYFTKGQLSVKLGAGEGGVTVMITLQNILIPLSWCSEHALLLYIEILD